MRADSVTTGVPDRRAADGQNPSTPVVLALTLESIPMTESVQETPASTLHEAAVPLAWVPIRSLSPQHRDAAVAHLLLLPERDRYLRFGFQAGDTQIARYVAGIHFDRDDVFGVFNRKLDIVALAHVAYPDSEAAGAPAEFGVSVLPHLRGSGIGSRLFAHAMLHVRNRGLEKIYIHALSENTAMLRIARRAGATIERNGTESEAYLRLPHDTLASHAEALIGEGAAALDYRIKQQAKLVDSLIGAIGEVRSGAASAGREKV